MLQHGRMLVFKNSKAMVLTCYFANYTSGNIPGYTQLFYNYSIMTILPGQIVIAIMSVLILAIFMGLP